MARNNNPNTARARQRFIFMSQRKLRRVANEIRGKKAMEAVAILRFMPYFAAKVMLKNVIAAVHNVKQKMGEGFEPESLVISSVFVDEAAAFKRFKPRAQGRIYTIQKPTAHLTVEVTQK